MEALTPEVLVEWCRQTLPHDSQAFEQLVAQYKQRVFSRAYQLMRNPQEAEDQAQEVFLKVYRGIKDLTDPGTLTAWIDRITVNTCLDALTKQKRRPVTTPLAPLDAEGNEPMQYADQRLLGPEEAALQGETRRCLELALAQMDVQSRVVLVLRDIEDRPYQEVVEALGLGLSAVKMRIHRARLAFQRLLEAVCPDIWSTAVASQSRSRPEANEGTGPRPGFDVRRSGQ